MAIYYTINNRLSIIQDFLGEYYQWHQDVLSRAFYPQKGDDSIKAPEQFLEWLKSLLLEAINIDGRYDVRRSRLVEDHEKLMQAAENLKRPPSRDQLNDFEQNYRLFIVELQDFAQAMILEDWGLDVLTGLKNNAVLKHGLDVEMERLSREGSPFCLALARIDDFNIIEKNVDTDAADDVIKELGGLVQKCLRTYDEAYRVSRDHFIMCLKQSNIIGGKKALQRLRDLLDQTNKTYTLNGETQHISMSCCVAAPLPGDSIKELIDNLYIDLDTQIKDHGAVLAYQELSPLQRYMMNDEDESE